ncbi:MAG: phospholipase D-like domain-containing protein [Anaeromyxobacteraceae bacterium]|nr:phospholipase D-like domain-containing protein [Anaeromyxobacteraceae bacterium]
MALPAWLEPRARRPKDRLRLLDGGAEAYPAMLAAIEAAREEVFLEVYAFALDAVGERFIGALSAAARRGVRVRVVIDGWGSAPHAHGVAQRLEGAGCEVEIFNRMLFVLVGRWRRNHRKVLAVDGEVAFVGGLNVGVEYGLPGEPSAAAWADLAVEVRGPTAEWLLRRGRRERGHGPAGPFRVWLSGLGGGRRLRRRYLKAIGGARVKVLMAHAYFMPDRRLVRSITAAARRGVRVKLVLPARGDVALMRPAVRRLYRKLLAAGVEVREWHGSMLHAKVAVVDGLRLLLGSFNLDPLSLANLEALAEAEDQEVSAAGERWIEARLAEAVPVAPDAVPGSRLADWWDELAGRVSAALARWAGRFLSRR